MKIIFLTVKDILTMKSNRLFKIEWTKYFNSIFYYDVSSSTNYLFVIHRHGILKYNLDRQIIQEENVSPELILNEYMIQNHCTLDLNRNIIYLHIFGENKIVSFNIKTKEWDFKFYDFNNCGQYFLGLTNLAFISDPVNETIIQKRYHNNYVKTFKILNTGKLQVYEKKTKLTEENCYDLKLLDDHLYILKRKMVNHGIFDEIVRNLLKERSYKNLVHCHLAWNQIIFFIFEGNTGFYSIDCVDTMEPNNIHYNILGSKRKLKERSFDKIFFDYNNDLHLVRITDYYDDEQIHSKIDSMVMIPKYIVDKNRLLNGI